MSFIAGYIAGLEDGEDHSHEDKVIRENGVYTPDDGVRWDKVTVDVSSGGCVFTEIVKSLPSLAELQLPDGYKVDVCVDLNYELPLISPSMVDQGSAGIGENVFNEEKKIFERDYVNLTYVVKRLNMITRVYKDNSFQFALCSGSGSLYEYEQYEEFSVYPDSSGGASSYPRETKIGLLRKYKTKEVHCVPTASGDIFSFSIRRDSSKRIMVLSVSASAKAVTEHTERKFSANANGTVNTYYPVRYDIDTTVTEEENSTSISNSLVYSPYGNGSSIITDLSTIALNRSAGGFIIAAARHLGYTYYDNFDYSELV